MCGFSSALSPATCIEQTLEKALAPVRSCGEEKEALLLFKAEMMNDLPEGLNSGVICIVTALISGCLFKLCKIVMRKAADEQFQFFISEKGQCWASTDLVQTREW